MRSDRSKSSSSLPDAGAIPGRLSISEELENLSTREFLAEMRRRADAVRARWMAEDEVGEADEPSQREWERS